MSLVSFVNIPDHVLGMRQAVQDSLRLIHYGLPKRIRSVVIKPNMCYYWDYSTGETTDPNFVAALIDVIRDQVSPDVNISIVESDASAMKCKYAFKMLGYEKLAQRMGVQLVNLSEDEGEQVKVIVGEQLFQFMIPQTIHTADLLVNVPKIKYMKGTGISCALKNVFGCNPYPYKFRYHGKLDEAIVALNKIMRFHLCVVEGNVVSGVQPRRLGLVMASQDPVAIDVAAAKIAGLNPRAINHITLAKREGLGNISHLSKGIALDYFRERYPKAGPKRKIMGFAYDLLVAMGISQRLGFS